MSPINNIFPLEHGLLAFVATIPHSTTMEDILKPEYWANVYKKLTAHKTHIHANWEDGSRLVVLRVIGVGVNYAKVRVMHDYSFVEDIEKSKPRESGNIDDYEVAFKTYHHKWSVIRKSDKSYVKDMFDTEVEAREWLERFVSGEVAKAA